MPMLKEENNETKVETRASIMKELGLSTIQNPKIMNEPLSPKEAKEYRELMTAIHEKYL